MQETTQSKSTEARISELEQRVAHLEAVHQHGGQTSYVVHYWHPGYPPFPQMAAPIPPCGVGSTGIPPCCGISAGARGPAVPTDEDFGKLGG